MSVNWHRFPPAGYDGDFVRADISVGYWVPREKFERDLDTAIRDFRDAALRVYDYIDPTNDNV